MKVIDYTIISTYVENREDRETFVRTVKEHIDNGWQPANAMILTRGGNQTFLLKEMVKYDDG